MAPLRMIQLFDLAHFSAGPLTLFFFRKKENGSPKEKNNYLKRKNHSGKKK